MYKYIFTILVFCVPFSVQAVVLEDSTYQDPSESSNVQQNTAGATWDFAFRYSLPSTTTVEIVSLPVYHKIISEPSETVRLYYCGTSTCNQAGALAVSSDETTEFHTVDAAVVDTNDSKFVDFVFNPPIELPAATEVYFALINDNIDFLYLPETGVNKTDLRSYQVTNFSTSDSWSTASADDYIYEVYSPDLIEGCTNPAALNYDISATVDDGSCLLSPSPYSNFLLATSTCEQVATTTVCTYKYSTTSNAIYFESNALNKLTDSVMVGFGFMILLLSAFFVKMH